MIMLELSLILYHVPDILTVLITIPAPPSRPPGMHPKVYPIMPIIGLFFEAIATVLGYILQIYLWIVIARAVLSWVNPDPYNPIVRFIYNLTEPVLYIIRSRLPVQFGGVDLSPIVVFLAIVFLQKFLVGTLLHIAFILR